MNEFNRLSISSNRQIRRFSPIYFTIKLNQHLFRVVEKAAPKKTKGGNYGQNFRPSSLLCIF